MIFTEKTEIKTIAPFNFELSAKIFANGDKQIRKYENGRFWQVLKVNKKLMLIIVKSLGTTNAPKLSIELKSAAKISENDKKKAREIVRFLFNLDFDVTPFYREIANDSIFARLIPQLTGLESPTTQTVFEALIDSIIEQQISLKVANTFERKIIKKFGPALNLDGEIYYAYPTPNDLARAGCEALRSIGLSQRKAEYVTGVSALITEGKLDLEKLKTLENADDIITELDKIRGVGVWTAELTMLRGMQRLEAFPADDLGLRRTISSYYCGGKPITSGEARQIAKGWGKWKGLAAYYLIVAEMLGIEP